MPKLFDGVRELGWWIVRDIYFGASYSAANAITQGKAKVDAVINEVAAVGGFDRIFAWELGNEFRADTEAEIAALTSFVCAMATHIKARLAEPGRERFSNWVTWGSWTPNDPLRSDGNPVLDYVSLTFTATTRSGCGIISRGRSLAGRCRLSGGLSATRTSRW